MALLFKSMSSSNKSRKRPRGVQFELENNEEYTISRRDERPVEEFQDSSSSEDDDNNQDKDDGDDDMLSPKRRRSGDLGDDDNNNNGGMIMSEKELLEAKRARRQKQLDADAFETQQQQHHHDSLAEEGIAIEPFNMKEESRDGSGYFEGDTYVFRRQEDGAEEDAWWDSLPGDAKLPAKKSASTTDDDGAKDVVNDLDDLPDYELYERIIPLMGVESETVMQAISRYGSLLDRGRATKKRGAASRSANDNSSSSKAENETMAQAALDTLTAASSALMLRGMAGIYQKKKGDLRSMMFQQPVASASSTLSAVANAAAAVQPKPTTEKAAVQWEYQGSQDKAIHGPYSTQEMQGWIAQGYFVGASAVQVRTIQEKAQSEESAKPKETKEELLADLMDDDDDDDDDDATGAESNAVAGKVYGEWMRSDQVKFLDYL